MRRILRQVTSMVLALMMILSLTITGFAEEIPEVPAAIASTYNTAFIMQGNTDDEGDCRATVNGLIASGSYIVQSISTAGWHYTDSNTSEIYPTMLVSATQFTRAKNYTFAYYSGHGWKRNNLPIINYVNGGATTEIEVANVLGVNTSSWQSSSIWQPTDSLRVLVLSSCLQLDSSIMKYYARAMRASGIRAIAGYHDRSPGTGVDTYIANSFFSYALDGNSVKYSWQYGNTFADSIAPWAVLVYTENGNEYYRIPGFPGSSYHPPSSTATVYRFRSGLSGSEIVTTSTQTGTVLNTEGLPLYLSLVPRTDLIEYDGREPVSLGSSISSNSSVSLVNATQDDIGAIVTNALPANYQCVQTPVYRDEVNLDGGAVAGSETVVEYIYHFFDTYNGIKIADSSIVVGVDADGIYSVKDYRKNVANTAVPMDVSVTVTNTDLITSNTALSCLDNVEEFGDFELLRSELVYAPIEDGSTTYKLCYQLLGTDSRIAYVDAATGAVLNI